jgi:hypothetical protein
VYIMPLNHPNGETNCRRLCAPLVPMRKYIKCALCLEEVCEPKEIVFGGRDLNKTCRATTITLEFWCGKGYVYTWEVYCSHPVEIDSLSSDRVYNPDAQKIHSHRIFKGAILIFTFDDSISLRISYIFV